MKRALSLCITILAFTPLAAAQDGERGGTPNIENLERYVVDRLYEIDDPEIRPKVERLVFTALGHTDQPGQVVSHADTHLRRRLLETLLWLQ